MVVAREIMLAKLVISCTNLDLGVHSWPVGGPAALAPAHHSVDVEATCVRKGEENPKLEKKSQRKRETSGKPKCRLLQPIAGQRRL